MPGGTGVGEPFAHLRVASGYSFRYGASHPSALVDRAAGLGMDILAMTDRDGLYGAVRFAKSCTRTGVRPVMGVDLGVSPVLPQRAPSVRVRTPARGGTLRDQNHPRVVALATSRTGWASLCRLTSATHLRGERGSPLSTSGIVAEHAADVLVMLGSDSELGRAVAAGRPDAAAEVLRRWSEAVGRDRIVVAATHHELPGAGAGTGVHAARMVAFADENGLPVVLTNDVRMATPELAPTVDVLDATRRLVPLDLRNIDRRNAEGYLKDSPSMGELAAQVSGMAGRRDGGALLLATTRSVAERCVLDPHADLGLGEIHLPELAALTGGTSAGEAGAVLRAACAAAIPVRYGTVLPEVQRRLDAELDIVNGFGFASYFLTIGRVVELIADMGIRCAARGSGTGSIVNYLLGISGVDPLAHGLVMERFLSPLRIALPDIDLDVESARRTEIYERILAEFGSDRVACIAMLDTYRVRHAVRDVGAALSLPPTEIDAIAKSFPHIRARSARAALRELPELRRAGLGEQRLDVLFSLVESLDGLPRHIALHPCGVLLSDTTLLDRTPVESSLGGFPMSQFDKDDVEDMGLLKLDVLGIRMQSAFAHTLDEIARVEGETVDIDALAPFDDPAVYDLAGKSATLGCFQIESPGQRELLGKFGPTTFLDIVIDISLFRPGPVKSDMIIPFLEARQGWREPAVLHSGLEPILAETGGVVVFHEQIIQIIVAMTGCTLGQGDEARRALGDDEGKQGLRRWLFPTAQERGYPAEVVERVWQVLESFASFGFCKAHAVSFALPTYQSAWLKVHYPAHFLSGVLTHDPGMYPKRLLLDEARRLGITVLGLDVNASEGCFRVVRLHDGPLPPAVASGRLQPGAGLPDGRAYGIRVSLADVAGITEAEIERIEQGRPFESLTDFWQRARASQPVTERLVLAGAFDALYGIGPAAPVVERNRVTRRDLLLALADLARADRADVRVTELQLPLDLWGADEGAPDAAPGDAAHDWSRAGDGVAGGPERAGREATWPGARARGPGGFPKVRDVVVTGLPEMTDDERLQAELSILGLDVSSHVVAGYLPLLTELQVTFSADLLARRKRRDVLIGGVKVATQTPPVRSGRRVIFLTLDDTTGPVDATFFEDVQGPYASTVFNSWMLVVRGQVRRTGPRGVSLLAQACWDLTELHSIYQRVFAETGDGEAALAAVTAFMDSSPDEAPELGVGEYSFSGPAEEAPLADPQQRTRGGGMGRRRVLVHGTGYEQSPYADVLPAGTGAAQAPRKLWHSSQGSAGR